MVSNTPVLCGLSRLSLVAEPPGAQTTDIWRNRLGLLLESTGEGIVGLDLNGCCTFINPAAARMLGYQAQDVLGYNMHDLIHHSHPDGAHYPVDQCPIFRSFLMGEPCRVDTEVLWRQDGSALPVEYTSHPILDGGQVLGAVVTFRDISERKHRQALLKQAHDELGGLLADLSKDLSWLEKRMGDQPMLRSKCHDMRGLIERATYSAGRITTDGRPTIVDEMGLWATLELQAKAFTDTGPAQCEWSMDIAPALSAPEGPMATAIYRIFQEMLSNVSRHAQATKVQLRIRATPSDITLLVKDNGRGAPPSVFDRHDAHGIAGMRERAGHFGGWLQIDSQPGQGTQLILSMPLRYAGAQNQGAANAA